MAAETIREIVSKHLVQGTPLAVALLTVAQDIDALERGLAAVVERVEQVESQQLVIS